MRDDGVSDRELGRRMEHVAEATGKTCYVGVRAQGKGWFASCAGVEVDAPTAAAVEDVIVSLRERMWSQRAAAVINAQLLSDSYDTLADLS